MSDNLDNRDRDLNGRIREKNSNTKVGTLRETYGDNFAEGWRSDAHLRTVLDDAGIETLSEYLKQQHGR
jgi:hypothetical protein